MLHALRHHWRGFETDDLVEAKTAALRTIAELAEQRDDVETALLDAIRDARNADRFSSEIGVMLGVSKWAAQFHRPPARVPAFRAARSLGSFGSSTWMTDAGPIDVLRELRDRDGRDVDHEALPELRELRDTS